MYYVYFAKSRSNDKIYVGYTSKLPEERVVEHNHGGSEWSSNNGPFDLIYYESFICKDDVLAREKFYMTGVGKKFKKIICDGLNTAP